MRIPHAMVLALASCGAAGAQSLQVGTGGAVLEGEAVPITAAGLRAGEVVTLRAQRWFAPISRSAKPPRRFRSEARLRADAQGTLDLARDAPMAGSWAGVDARGPFWSMVEDSSATAAAGADTSVVEFELLREAAPALRASVRLQPAADGVATVDADGLPGARFAVPPGEARLPALILLGGSEGGAMIADAAAPFASRGYAVLALPYFAPDGDVPGLPEAMLEQPVEYLDRAYRWLSRQPRVDASRVAIHGTSLGATYALLGALHYDWVDAVVANVPSDVVIDGWGPGIAEGTRSAFSWQGKPLPYVAALGYEEEMARTPARVRRVYERGRAAHPERAARARIAAEKIRGAVMVIGAYDDQMWPSGAMAQNLAERRLEAGLPVTARLYPDAGHFLFQSGYEPTTYYQARKQQVGGTPQADARAQADAWQATFQFLAAALAKD